jgi:hypothetical protein
MWNRKIEIDRIHCRAITDEIGERLRIAYSQVSPELPPRIPKIAGPTSRIGSRRFAFDCSFDPRI